MGVIKILEKLNLLATLLDNADEETSDALLDEFNAFLNEESVKDVDRAIGLFSGCGIMSEDHLDRLLGEK